MIANQIVRRLRPNYIPKRANGFKYQDFVSYRYLSSNDDFRKTLNDMKNRSQEEGSPKKEPEENPDAFSQSNISMLSKAKDWTINSSRNLWYNIRLAYDEMVGESQDSILTKKVHQAESFRKRKENEEGEDKDVDDEKAQDESFEPAGPSAIVVMKEPKGAWEQMKERLQDSPLIREILKKSKVVGKAAVETDLGKQAQNVGRSVKDKVEDLREFWETSQNPIVYTLSGVWDNMTGETEEGIALNEIKKLDPKFSKEEWALEVKKNLAPSIIKAHLQGDIKYLKKWLGEAVFNKLAADIRMRKADGITFDSNILDIDENQLIVRYLEGGGPIIVGVYMVQQINCIKNRKGEIIEGNESDIRAKFYSIAFQQNYDEDSQTVSWKVVDYEFAGDMPYY